MGNGQNFVWVTVVINKDHVTKYTILPIQPADLASNLQAGDRGFELRSGHTLFGTLRLNGAPRNTSVSLLKQADSKRCDG